MPKLNDELAIAHGSGRYARLLAQWAKTDIMILDDLAMAPLTDSARRDLLEMLDDRHGHRRGAAQKQNAIRDANIITLLLQTEGGEIGIFVNFDVGSVIDFMCRLRRKERADRGRIFLSCRYLVSTDRFNRSALRVGQVSPA